MPIRWRRRRSMCHPRYCRDTGGAPSASGETGASGGLRSDARAAASATGAGRPWSRAARPSDKGGFVRAGWSAAPDGDDAGACRHAGPPGHGTEYGIHSAASRRSQPARARSSYSPSLGCREDARAGTPEHGIPHPFAAPNTAALPPVHPSAVLPPARQARPVITAPAHPPVAAGVRREAPLHPAAPPEPRPAPVNEAHPVALPHPAPPPTQAFRPPAPAVARPVPALARPVAPPHPAPAQAFHPPAPAVAHPATALAHPVAPPHLQPGHASQAAHGGGKPAPKEKGKESENRP